jgi:hypothetical protein
VDVQPDPLPDPAEPEMWAWAPRFSNVVSTTEARGLWESAFSAGVGEDELKRLVAMACERLDQLGVS